jgi:hypothetical protein
MKSFLLFCFFFSFSTWQMSGANAAQPAPAEPSVASVDSAWLDAAPRQLNIEGFAQCLNERQAVDWNVIERSYSFGAFDLLLPFLAVYPGTRAPPPISFVQDAANDAWSTQWEKRESALAQRLAAQPPRAPGELFAQALAVCPKADSFCAVLMAHNVLRTLGRYPQGESHDASGEGTDYNPEWFRSRRSEWIAAIPRIQAAMISLRADGGGDRWGEWYHAFGIVAYAVHAIEMGSGSDWVDFVAGMNEILNPWLAGGPEDPAKARLDHDSARMAWIYLKEAPQPLAGLDCAAARAYVAAPPSPGRP